MEQDNEKSAVAEKETTNGYSFGGMSDVQLLGKLPHRELSEDLDSNYTFNEEILDDYEWVIGDFNQPEWRFVKDYGVGQQHLFGLDEGNYPHYIKSEPMGTEPARPDENDTGFVNALSTMGGQAYRGIHTAFKELAKRFGNDYPEITARFFLPLAIAGPRLLDRQVTEKTIEGAGKLTEALSPPEKKDSLGATIAHDVGRVGTGLFFTAPFLTPMKIASNITSLGTLGQHLLRAAFGGFGRSAAWGGLAEGFTLPEDEKTIIDEFLTPYLNSLKTEEQHSLANVMIGAYEDIFSKDPEAEPILNDLSVFAGGTVEGGAFDALLRGLVFGIKKIGAKRLLAAGGILAGAIAKPENAEAGVFSPLLKAFGLGPDDLGFYSKAAREVSEIAQDTMPAAEWKSFLLTGKTPRMKKEEWEWLGMDEFFKRKHNQSADMPISKEELLEHIKMNSLVIKEKRYAGGDASFEFHIDHEPRTLMDLHGGDAHENYGHFWSRSFQGRSNLRLGNINEHYQTASRISHEMGIEDYFESEIVTKVDWDKQATRTGIRNYFNLVFEELGDVSARAGEFDIAERFNDLSGDFRNDDYVDHFRTQLSTANTPLFGPSKKISLPMGGEIDIKTAREIVANYDTGIFPYYLELLQRMDSAEDAMTAAAARPDRMTAAQKQAFEAAKSDWLDAMEEASLIFDDMGANENFAEELSKYARYEIRDGRTFDDFDEAVDETNELLREEGGGLTERFEDIEWANGEEIHGPAKWGDPQYRTRGGENYRELSLSFPDVQRGEPARRMGSDRFHEAHFGRGVFAHARVSEISMKGDRTYIIEEIQSTHHQRGFKQGYKTPVPEMDEATQARFDKYKKYRSLYYDERMGKSESIRGGDPGLTKEYESLENEFEQYIGNVGQVPDAPFKRTWPEFTLKRLITDAVERGYDRIAWTPEAEQTRRYGSAAVPKLYKLIYEDVVPQWVKKWLKKTDPDVKIERSDSASTDNYFTFKLTEKLKDAVRSGNFELFAVGTPLAAAMTMMQTGGISDLPEERAKRGELTAQQYLDARRQAIADGESQAFIDRHFPLMNLPPEHYTQPQVF